MLSTPITPAHEFWPLRLEVLDDQPEQLWVAGDAGLLIVPMIAVVGSRASTPYGNRMAVDITTGLLERFAVVSGGAFGIDSSVHRAVLAGKGRTVVVQPGGMDKLYPVAHDLLFDRIVNAGGLILSEYPPHAVPNRDRFLHRNRIIAALAVGMVIIEAGKISGARAAANWATKLHRPLMVVPGPVTSAQSDGCHELIRAGATLVRNTKDVLQVLG